MANDMDTKKPHTVIQQTATSVLAPVRELCTSVKDFSEMVISRLPTDEQLRDAKRKNELAKRQIIAVRQVEQRIEIDQNSIQKIRGKLDGLENELQSLQEKAEVSEYEVTLFEQEIPSLKNLLATKFGIGTKSLPIVVAENPDTSKVSFLPEISVNISLPPSSPSVVVTPPSPAQYRSRLRPPGSQPREAVSFPLSAQKPFRGREPFSSQYTGKQKEETQNDRHHDFERSYAERPQAPNNDKLPSGLKFRPNHYNASQIPPPNQNTRETLSSNPFAGRNTQFAPNYPNLAASTSSLSYSYHSPQQQTTEMFHNANNAAQMSSSRIPGQYMQQSASRDGLNSQGPSMSGSFISSALRAPAGHYQSASSLPQYASQHNLQTSRISPIRNVPRSEMDEIADLMQRLKGKQVRAGL